MIDKAVQEQDIDGIVCRKQVREEFCEESLAGLAQSIKESGVLQPLLVHREGSSFVLDDGERRLLAAKRAGLTTVPVIVDDRELCEAEVIHRQLVANCQRADLSAMEKANAIQRLMRETGWVAAECAQKLGMSKATVSKLLSLLGLPDDVRAQVDAGRIPASTAYELARAGDDKSQSELAELVASNGMSRDATAGAVRSRRRQAAPANNATARRVTAMLGPGRTVTVCGAGLTLGVFIEWLEELLGKARKWRPKGVELDTFLRMLRDESKGNEAC